MSLSPHIIFLLFFPFIPFSSSSFSDFFIYPSSPFSVSQGLVLLKILSFLPSSSSPLFLAFLLVSPLSCFLPLSSIISPISWLPPLHPSHTCLPPSNDGDTWRRRLRFPPKVVPESCYQRHHCGFRLYFHGCSVVCDLAFYLYLVLILLVFRFILWCACFKEFVLIVVCVDYHSFLCLLNGFSITYDYLVYFPFMRYGQTVLYFLF